MVIILLDWNGTHSNQIQGILSDSLWGTLKLNTVLCRVVPMFILLEKRSHIFIKFPKRPKIKKLVRFWTPHWLIQFSQDHAIIANSSSCDNTQMAGEGLEKIISKERIFLMRFSLEMLKTPWKDKEGHYSWTPHRFWFKYFRLNLSGDPLFVEECHFLWVIVSFMPRKAVSGSSWEQLVPMPVFFWILYPT